MKRSNPATSRSWRSSTKAKLAERLPTCVVTVGITEQTSYRWKALIDYETHRPPDAQDTQIADVYDGQVSPKVPMEVLISYFLTDTVKELESEIER